MFCNFLNPFYVDARLWYPFYSEDRSWEVKQYIDRTLISLRFIFIPVAMAFISLIHLCSCWADDKFSRWSTGTWIWKNEFLNVMWRLWYKHDPNVSGKEFSHELNLHHSFLFLPWSNSEPTCVSQQLMFKIIGQSVWERGSQLRQKLQDSGARLSAPGLLTVHAGRLILLRNLHTPRRSSHALDDLRLHCPQVGSDRFTHCPCQLTLVT